MSALDVDVALGVVRDGFSRDAVYAGAAIAEHVNDLTNQRDQARRIACSLESELAEQTDEIKLRNAEITRQHAQVLALDATVTQQGERIAEALGFLTDALVWCTNENTAAGIEEAMAALRGEQP